MPSQLNIIERATLARRLQVNKRKIDELESLLSGVPLRPVKFTDLSIISAKIQSLSADQIDTGSLQIGEKILINDGANNRILITRDDIRISKEGVDVEKTITESNKKDFILLSLTELHKLRFAGVITSGTYTHNLGRIPIFFVWNLDEDLNYRQITYPKATTTQITGLVGTNYLMVFNEGANP